MNINGNKLVWVHDRIAFSYADKLGLNKKTMPKTIDVDGVGVFEMDGTEGSDNKVDYYLYWNNNLLLKIAV